MARQLFKQLYVGLMVEEHFYFLLLKSCCPRANSPRIKNINVGYDSSEYFKQNTSKIKLSLVFAHGLLFLS